MISLLSPAIDNANKIADAVEAALTAIMGDPDIASMALEAVGWLAIVAGAAIFLVVYVIGIIFHWRICSKAGYSGAWSLLMVLPIIGYVFLILFLTFGKWGSAKS